MRGEYRANIEWDIRRYGTTSACAENTVSKSSTAPTVMELPPRARRIRGSPYIGSLYGGTTSACAENTVGFHWCGFPPWNYLRVRGEYTFIDGESGEELELPPRARRILQKSVETGAHGGTTSACAENTPQHTLTRTHVRNYLRVRGEYTK